MLSMQSFFYLLLNLALYGTLAVGVVAASAYLFGFVRQRFCRCRPGLNAIAAAITAVAILFSLALLPQESLMDLPIINAVPMLIYIVYFVLGVVHLCLWHKAIIELMARCAIVSTSRCAAECRCNRAEPIDPCGCRREPGEAGEASGPCGPCSGS